MPVHLGHRLCAGLTRLVQLLAEADHLGLQFEHPLHAGQVHALGCEVGDPLEHGYVRVAVPTVPAGGPGRIHQAPTLIDAQRLWVHPGQLGGHGDHVHGLVGPGPDRHHPDRPSSPYPPACRIIATSTWSS